MSTTVSRRSILKGSAAAVVGWSAVNATWVTAASATESGVALVPALDGTLETAPAAIGNFSKDFGNLITGVPRAVLRPGSVRDVVSMVNYARRNDLTIAMNGQSGTGQDIESHSSYGQAQVPGGISIDAKGLSKIHFIRPDIAMVDAGVTWAALTDAALAHGRTPPALTDYLHLSVGGTISVGGIGGTVQKHGLLCDTVEMIEIVTGDGRRLVASRAIRPDLFNAALAGGGQVGIIVRAAIRLVAAPTRALLMNLFYDDLATYLADQEKILNDGRFSHQEGEIVRQPDDSGWWYKIEAVTYYTPPTVPDQAALLAGLRDDRPSAQTAEFSYHDWIFRLDPFEAFLKDGGYWDQPKPWLSLILPASQTQTFIRSVVAELTPADLGVGFAGLYPFSRSKLTRPLFALPDSSEPVLYLFDLLRFPFPDDPGIPGMLAHNRRLYDQAVALGAKRYLVGAVPDMTSLDWRRHFGRHWSRLVAAKRQFAPDTVLTPGQGFFAQP